MSYPQIAEALLEIIVCPTTKQRLSVLSTEELAAVNEQITGGRLKNFGGEQLTEPLVAALIRADGSGIYPIRNGIPILLAEELISR